MRGPAVCPLSGLGTRWHFVWPRHEVASVDDGRQDFCSSPYLWPAAAAKSGDRSQGLDVGICVLDCHTNLPFGLGSRCGFRFHDVWHLEIPGGSVRLRVFRLAGDAGDLDVEFLGDAEAVRLPVVQ